MLNLVSLAFTAGALLFLILRSFSRGAAGRVRVHRRRKGRMVLALLRWPVLLLAVLGGWPCSTATARVGMPPAGAGDGRQCRRGGTLAGGSLLFSWYVANFGSYNKTYGSLGAAIGFMTWIWISTTIVLLGRAGERRDGAPDRRGHDGGRAYSPSAPRGAKMADSVWGTAE